MTRVLSYVSGITAGRVWSGDEWDAVVFSEFGPYFRRRKQLRKYKDIMRIEVMNLAQICNFKEERRLLSDCLRTFRSALRRAPSETVSFLCAAHPRTVAADTHWMRFFESFQPPSASMPIDARINASFTMLDNVLEGALKPRLVTVAELARYAIGQTGHPDPWNADLGAHVAQFPAKLEPRFRLMLRDPEFQITTNQWRNIAAHKSYATRSSRTLTVAYGKPPKSRSLTFAALRRTVGWATRMHLAVRLALVIFHLDHFDRLLAGGLNVSVSLSLSASLLHLAHALRTVGFEARSTTSQRRTLTLAVVDLRGRSVREAIVHVSQALDRLAGAVHDDVATRGLYDRVAVDLQRLDGSSLAVASVDVARALAWAHGEIAQREYVDSIIFATDPSGGTA